MTKLELEWAVNRLGWYDRNKPDMPMAEKFATVYKEWEELNKLTTMEPRDK